MSDNKDMIEELENIIKKISWKEKEQILKNLNVIDEVMTVKEAAEIWCKHPTTIVKLITTTNKLNQNIDYKKSAGTWLITVEAMRRLYGDPINKL